jgi:hypothetical protein
MPELEHLLDKRALVLDQMQAIDRLRRGSLSKQFFASAADDRQRGPYFVLQGFFHGKKFSQRIPADQADEVQQQVDNYRRFQQLAEDYVTLTDQITRLEAAPAESKKNSSLRRSSKSALVKPKPS